MYLRRRRTAGGGVKRHSLRCGLLHVESGSKDVSDIDIVSRGSVELMGTPAFGDGWLQKEPVEVALD